MFPARAGMSPVLHPCLKQRLRVPRASGDEPDYQVQALISLMCSPRERG